MYYFFTNKQQNGFRLRKFILTNLPPVGVELGSLGPQAGLENEFDKTLASDSYSLLCSNKFGTS